MRYDLKLDRQQRLSANIIVRCYLNRYSWDLVLKSHDFAIHFGTPRLYKHSEVAVYDALKYAKQHVLKFSDHHQQLLILWLRQVFDNAWLHVPMNQRLTLLDDDRVRPTPCFVRQIAAHQAQPVSQQLGILASMDNAGMRTRMCHPLSFAHTDLSQPTNNLALAFAS
jgi:hypothetical protein